MLSSLPVDASALIPYTLAYNNQCWHEAMAYNNTWLAAGVDSHFHCGLERDTQKQIWLHLPIDSVVLEVGSRYGTMSCTIAKRQKYSGLRVSVEPDRRAFDKFLQVNARANRCAGVNVHGVVSASRAAFTSGAGYGGAATSAVHGAIPGYNITALQSRLAARRPFTALFLDCEGCTLAFLNEHAAFLRHPSLERVFIELDQNQAELAKVLRRLCAYGFELRASDPNLTCCPTILHLVFERARGADASTSSTRHCPSSLSLSANFQRRAHWSAAEVSESQRLGAFAGRVFSTKWWDWAKDFLA